MTRTRIETLTCDACGLTITRRRPKGWIEIRSMEADEASSELSDVIFAIPQHVCSNTCLAALANQRIAYWERKQATPA